MEKFLKTVAKEIYNSNQNLDKIFIVFPNKRSSIYFQRELSNRVGILEKWRWIIIGGSIVAGFILHKVIMFAI